MKKLIYERFMDDVDTVGEFGGFARRPLFLLDTLPKVVGNNIPLPELPYDQFYVEIGDTLMFVSKTSGATQESVAGEIYMNFIPEDKKWIFLLVYTFIFKNNNLIGLFFPEDMKGLNCEMFVADNGDVLSRMAKENYAVLHSLLLYLKTPVLKQEKIGFKRKSLPSNFKDTQLTQYTRVTIDKSKIQKTYQQDQQDEQEESDLLGSKRWHECRGHFKHYTEEKPLFGHTTGTIWVKPHNRGDVKKGVVFKQYVVK